MTQIILPWPPASLSGHANGHWRTKAVETRKHRQWARDATLAANPGHLPASGDIEIKFRFEPPNNRSDRTNFANRVKPAIDGIADALKVNDKRFLPSYEYGPPVKNGRVIVTLGPT